MARKHIWGIDIGSSAIRAVKLTRTPEGVRLADYDIRQLSYTGREEENILEAIRKALVGLAGRKSLIGERIIISVSGSLCFQRVVKIPPSPVSKIPEMMRYEAQQQIPFKLSDVVWDYKLISSPTDVSEGRKIALFALKRSVLDPMLQFCRDALMRVVGVQLSHIALYNYLNWELTPDYPIAVLDIGFKNTEFAVFTPSESGDMLMRSLPISGMHLTESVAERARLSFLEAEQMKNTGLQEADETVMGYVAPVLNNLSAEVKRSMGFFKSQLSGDGKEIEKLYLSGRAMSFPNGASILSNEIDMPVSPVVYPQKIAYSLVGSPEMFFEDCKQLSIAFGLALQGIGEAKISSNLLPKEHQLDNILAEKRAPVLIALGVIWAVLLISFFYINSTNTKTVMNSKALKKAVKELEADDAAYTHLLDKIPPEMLLAGNLASFTQGRALPIEAIDKVSAALCSAREGDRKLWLVSYKVDDITSEKLNEWALALNLPGVTTLEHIILFKASNPSPEEEEKLALFEPCRQSRWFRCTIKGIAQAGKGNEKLMVVEKFRKALEDGEPHLSEVTIPTDWKKYEFESPAGNFTAIDFSISFLIEIPPYEKSPEVPENPFLEPEVVQ